MDPCDPVSPAVDVFGQPAGLDRSGGPWNGLKTSVPEELLRGGWQFNLLPGEAAKLLGQFDALRIEIARAAQAEGITFACEGGRDAFLGHGWWQGRQLTLPNTITAPPWSPHRWQPYVWERGARAIRTGNDSALTQANGEVAISGAVHPNLTGHSLLADVVMRRLGLGALPPQPPRIAPVFGPR